MVGCCSNVGCEVKAVPPQEFVVLHTASCPPNRWGMRRAYSPLTHTLAPVGAREIYIPKQACRAVLGKKHNSR